MADAVMDQEIRTPRPFIRRGTLIAMGAAVVAALICFAVVAVLPAPAQPSYKNFVRSFLTGVGLVGIAYPLCTFGLALKRKAASSPYFETGFIAGVVNLAGFLCGVVGLVCIGFGVYDLVVWLLNPR